MNSIGKYDIEREVTWKDVWQVFDKLLKSILYLTMAAIWLCLHMMIGVHYYRHKHMLALFPDSFWGREKSLVHTVCACIQLRFENHVF